MPLGHLYRLWVVLRPGLLHLVVREVPVVHDLLELLELLEREEPVVLLFLAALVGHLDQ